MSEEKRHRGRVSKWNADEHREAIRNFIRNGEMSSEVRRRHGMSSKTFTEVLGDGFYKLFCLKSKSGIIAEVTQMVKNNTPVAKIADMFKVSIADVCLFMEKHTIHPDDERLLDDNGEHIDNIAVTVTADGSGKRLSYRKFNSLKEVASIHGLKMSSLVDAMNNNSRIKRTSTDGPTTWLKIQRIETDIISEEEVDIVNVGMTIKSIAKLDDWICILEMCEDGAIVVAKSPTLRLAIESLGDRLDGIDKSTIYKRIREEDVKPLSGFIFATVGTVKKYI